MDYIKIRFGSDINQTSLRFEKTIQEMFHPVVQANTINERAWKPLMDIYESANEIMILGEIAGVQKENLQLEITSRAVRIFGRRCGPFSCQEDNTTFRMAEIQYGTFDRILYLPELVDPEKVQASYANGFLQIRLKKLPAEKTHHIKIDIRD